MDEMFSQDEVLERKRRRFRLTEESDDEEEEKRLSLRRKQRVLYTEDDGEEEEEEEEEEEHSAQPGPSSQSTHIQKRSRGLLLVICGNKKGLLDVDKLASGEMCIECEGCWISPPAFEILGGKGCNKKWKSSISLKNKPLQFWFEQGYLMTPGFKKRSTANKKKKTTSASSESERSESLSEESEEEVLEEDESTEEDWHPDHDEASEELTLETQEEEEGRQWHENGGGDKDLRGERNKENDNMAAGETEDGADADDDADDDDSNGSSVSEGEGNLWYIIPGYERHVEKGLAKQRSCLHILVERLSEVRCELLPSSCMHEEHQVGEDRRIPWDEDGDNGMEAIQSSDDEIIDPVSSVSSGDIKEEGSPPDVKPSVAGDAGSSCNHISSFSPFPVLSVSAEHTTLLPVSMILEYDDIILKQEEKEDKDSQTEQRREQEQKSEPVAAEYLLDWQQQPDQAEATTDTLSQNHCPPSSGPGSAVCVSHCPARVPHNLKKKALGWSRRRSLRLPAAQGCCGRDKALDRRRERREMVMVDALQQICESQHKIIGVLDQLCSKQATLIKLVQRLNANMKSRR